MDSLNVSLLLQCADHTAFTMYDVPVWEKVPGLSKLVIYDRWRAPPPG